MASPDRRSASILLAEAWQKAQLTAGNRKIVEDALLTVLGRVVHADFIYRP